MKPSLRTALRLGALVSILGFLASAGGGTYLFYFALARKGPAHEERAAATDEIAAQSRLQGRAWMRASPFETLSASAKDGVSLRGYYRGGPSRRTAVLVHGYGTNASLMADYARFYLEDGINVFLPDNRAHGASGGQWVGMGWLDRDDLLVWIQALIEKANGGCEILLHGISMGAAAVMMAGGAEIPSQVKCLIADCGYTSVEAQFKYQLEHMFGLPPFPLFHIASLESKIIAGYGFAEASALEAVKKSRIPIFFIHGDADDFVPARMARELYESAPGEKRLWLVPGAQHAMAYYANPQEYVRQVRDFYREFLSDP
ncbi:MAG: alpha/beta hydrolase [Spirochaetia bacterium]|jgi:fermentation-respiration switch protein FrsA (DUF1100 family)|nr:alpha/beta hydrolase [Spirochaetia bacterium]